MNVKSLLPCWRLSTTHWPPTLLCSFLLSFKELGGAELDREMWVDNYKYNSRMDEQLLHKFILSSYFLNKFGLVFNKIKYFIRSK